MTTEICHDCGKPAAPGHALKFIARRNPVSRRMEPQRICSGCLSREPSELLMPHAYAPSVIKGRKAPA